VRRVLVRPDDEVYRVDSVWLGPPRATFPWRARYVSYALGLVVMILVMFVQRRIGIGLDFFSVAWALVVTVVLTRFLGQRIDDERPLGQVFVLFWHEVSGPRRRTRGDGGRLRPNRVRIGPIGRARRPAAGIRRTPTTGVAAWSRTGGRGSTVGPAVAGTDRRREGPRGAP
jgi:hypothetical protein